MIELARHQPVYSAAGRHAVLGHQRGRNVVIHHLVHARHVYDHFRPAAATAAAYYVGRRADNAADRVVNSAGGQTAHVRHGTADAVRDGRRGRAKHVLQELTLPNAAARSAPLPRVLFDRSHDLLQRWRLLVYGRLLVVVVSVVLQLDSRARQQERAPVRYFGYPVNGRLKLLGTI